MSKRRITHRQQKRIEKIQQLRQQRALRQQSHIHTTQPEQLGLVLSRYGATVDVEADDGSHYHCFQRQHLGHLVAGDRVTFRPSNDHQGIIESLLPRQTVLARTTLHEADKPIAANIDCMAIVIAPLPIPSSQLLDSYLVAAELLQIEPLIVLNKYELLEAKQSPFQDITLDCYQQLGYTVLTASAALTQGMQALEDHLRDKCGIFVGQSGVGKSSLLATLLPDESLRVGPLSAKSKLGQHTTTAAKLYHLPQGGDLIDSPGVRNFKLWTADPQQVFAGFKEFIRYQGQCKFRDCQHQHEPGCAIQTALKAGDIHPSRLHSFHKIIKK